MPQPKITDHRPNLFTRLRRNRAGNVLAMSAMLMIPLAGLVGGGVDIGRLYIAKTRLQHACDAGALAGRKAMGGGTWAANNYASQTTALQFFDGNYEATAYGGDNRTRSFTEQAGKVSGTASVTMPMTVMKIFGEPEKTLTVTCDAEMRLPNTDVMFVLDVTGSMAQKAVSTDSETKIEGLRTAVKCFYETVARLDISDANCVGGAPSGGTGSQVQVRFGFMPYSINVNVGRLLPPSWFADSATYQSRLRNGLNSAWGDWISYKYTAANSQGNCVYNNTLTEERRNGVNIGAGICQWEYRQFGPEWSYGPKPVDISRLKSGNSWKASFLWPIADDGSDRTITWEGCIEERQTVRASSYSPIPANARDLDIDSVPTSDPATKWKPALKQLIYLRKMTTAGADNSYDNVDAAAPVITANKYSNSPGFACPAQAAKLTTWPNADDFKNYVNSLQPVGNTYHDIGMLWGARFMSPTGIFASQNALTPQGGEIARHMIYMTDGDAQANPCDYTAYGLSFFDKRTTTDVGAAADCNKERQAIDDQINARLEALCTAVKNKSITLWVVSFGGGSNSSTEARLERCASPNRYFVARNSTTLQTTFQQIANQISQLRLTK